MGDRRDHQLHHTPPLGHPGPGLLAQEAVERGLARKPWVKTSLARVPPWSPEYLESQGCDKYLTSSSSTWSATAARPASGTPGRCRRRSQGGQPTTTSSSAPSSRATGTSRGGSTPIRSANYLASPPLVVAYRARRPDGHRPDQRAAGEGCRRPARLPLRRLPSTEEIREVVGDAVRADTVHQELRGRLHGRQALREIEIPRRTATPGPTPPTSQAEFLRGQDQEPKPVEPISGAVCSPCWRLGHDDHISPAGADQENSPAGEWLQETGGGGARLSTRTARAAGTTR